MRRSLLLAAALALAVGCADPFAEAQKLDTIESYQSFLDANPTSPHRLAAEIRLEELMLDQVRAEPTLEGYDAFLERWKDSGRLLEKAKAERENALYKWAEDSDSEEAWQKVVDELARGDKDKRKKARKRLNMAKEKHRVEVGPVEQEQINLAENPDGPLDGWGFYSEVKNVGDQPISYLILRLDYLGNDGQVLDSDRQAAAARYWNVPMPDTFYKPIMPGETRKWEWTSGDLPVGWAKKVKLKPVEIVVGIEEEEDED